MLSTFCQQSFGRFIFDSRDRAGEERLEILNQREGVWRCRTVFNCTEACPRDIEITKAIEEVKRSILLKDHRRHRRSASGAETRLEFLGAVSAPVTSAALWGAYA